MRGIVKIDTTPRSSSGSATRYASERDRNPRRESSNSRSLFTPDRDGLKWRAADSYLSGRPGAKPRSSDLHHIIFSFDKKDARGLENFDDDDRDRGFRLATRAGMKRILDRLKTKEPRWAAVVHRHNKHTHVHVLLNKEAQDSETGEIKRISRFPREMLNSRDPATGKGRDGLINLDMAEAIDNLLRREREEPAQPDDRLTDHNFDGSDRPTARNPGSAAPPERPSDGAGEKNFSAPKSEADPGKGQQPQADTSAPAHTPARRGLLSHLKSAAEDQPRPTATEQQSPALTNETPATQKLGNPGRSVAHFLGNREEVTSTPGAPAGERAPSSEAMPALPDAAEHPGRARNPYTSPLTADESRPGTPDSPPAPDLDDLIDIDF